MDGIEDIVAHAVELRRQIHRRPELGYQEEATAAAIRAELDRLAIRWRACAGTGTVARLAEGRDGEHRALRADIDALPLQELAEPPWRSEIDGRMHACGHDGHTASLLAAAACLKAHEDALPGPVTLLFQPAEEGGHGARAMIDDGALDGIDRIFGYHNWPPLPFGTVACPPGPLMAANGEWTLTVRGKGGHAATPQDCVDPVPVGAAVVAQIQTLVSRELPPQEAGVISATCFHAGTAATIIPDHVELAGTVRAASTARRDALAHRVEEVAGHCAAAAGCRSEFAYQPSYPATVNHPDAAAHLRECARRVIGPDCLRDDGLPIMGAEDFSYYLERVPGAYCLLGAGEEGAPLYGCHSPRFDFNDRLIPVVCRLWMATVGLEGEGGREHP